MKYFQHSKRNFVSPIGHVISSIYCRKILLTRRGLFLIQTCRGWLRGLYLWGVIEQVHYYNYISIIISNGNRTEWSPIRSVIMWVINKIGRPRSESPICSITNMITDRIGRHEVLLPINHNFSKICDIIGFFLNQNTINSKFCFARSEKIKPFKRARDGAYCPIT